MSSSTSALANAVTAPPQVDPSAVAASAQPVTSVASTPQQPTLAAQPQPTSRLHAILSAVAQVESTALAGIPDKGRESFATGLGEGARAENAAQATQQDIKFKTFDDSVRAANLHNQDLELQMRTQEQQDAHQKAQDFQSDWDEDHGITYDPHPNDGKAVVDTLQGQTAANGSATIPAGTHLSADGNTINIPTNDDNTQAGMLAKYKALQGPLSLPSLPQNAQFVPQKYLDVMTHKMGGYKVDGSPWNHDDLPGQIGALQAQRDAIAKNGGSPYQLGTLDNTIGIMKAQKDALDDHADDVNTKAIALAGAKAKATADATLADKEALQNNAAANKPKPDTTQLDSVAFDPNYQNPDGTKGGNVVMSKADAAAKGLQHYKADPATLNTVVAGFNDVQNKLNQLADVVNDPSRMGQVVPGTAAAMLAHGKGIGADFHGIGIDTSRINEKLYAEDVAGANQATKDYVTAMVAAHDAMTNLPRLQTFGKSNRMTQQQLEAAVNLLPQPGDGSMASAKMTSLQSMIDPLRKQVPHMPGAELTPSWLEKQQTQKQAAPAPQTTQAVPTPVGTYNPSTRSVNYDNGR